MASNKPDRRDAADRAAIPSNQASEPSPAETSKPAAKPDPLIGVTTVLLKVAPAIRAVDDLDGRRIATEEAGADRRQAIEATLRSLSINPDITAVPAGEGDKELQAGTIAAVATLADNAAAARAPDKVFKVRIDPYILRRKR